ncbi:nitrous oxide-stimulated promoter family protein [Paenibacillus fonticola]|uniref:nitrous oxide-stimulated promoter family protein n=1 Tax=Paenibacillus fonticola TaxID=379896 RepID=UPI00036C1957|nr:nitrous oxide-stimulated promoter family protein [Paenibacillus fonticola]
MTSETRTARREGPRIRREKATVACMILIYCQGRHPEAEKSYFMDDEKEGGAGDYRVTGIRGRHKPGKRSRLCNECYVLYRYSQRRLTFCRFGEEKTTCLNCPVHCYAPKEREEIREVMRYAGGRMLFRHPVLAFCHVLDGRARRRLLSEG